MHKQIVRYSYIVITILIRIATAVYNFSLKTMDGSFLKTKSPSVLLNFQLT